MGVGIMEKLFVFLLHFCSYVIPCSEGVSEDSLKETNHCSSFGGKVHPKKLQI